MRQTGFRLLGPCLCAVALLAFVSAQTSGSAAPEPQPRDQPSSPSPEKSATTFHAESRLVVVDVVVTNRHREPVTGLSQSDFTVLEDGKPQAIRFFEAHVPPSASAKPAPVALPPHQYTNVSAQDPSSINIVLFDLLNTPPLDQPYAREQMVRFLQTVPPGQQVALFELGSKLRMLAGFGTTSEELLAAARKVVQHSSELLDTQAQREHDEEQLALLREGSIRDNNPVIFFEHKYLYRRIKEDVPEDDYVVPLGQARVAREGHDLSVITYAAMVHLALEAAELLAKEGIELEIIDLRTLAPLDRDAIVQTVKKTNKVILLHEDTRTGGIGGEIAAVINEEAFDDLDGPIVRIAALDTPVPFSPPQEEHFLPQLKDVVEKARWLKAY